MPLINMDNEEGKKRIKDMIDVLTNTPIISYQRMYGEYRHAITQSETDEEGNIYGYKVLIWDAGKMMFMSPVYPAYWGPNGELTADKNPGRTASHGIYFLKSGSDPELDAYYRQAEYRAAGYRANSRIFIVRCVLGGTIVEAERGFRVEHAKIEGVLDYGHWQTYQNFRAEAEAYYRRRYEEPRYTYQDWEAITKYQYTARDTDPLPRLASTDEDPAAD